MRRERSKPLELLVITGPRGAGKSTVAAELARWCNGSGMTMGGYYTEGAEHRAFVNAATGARYPFDALGDAEQIGRFSISRKSLADAAHTLLVDAADAYIVDEIGRLEAAGGGLHDALADFFARVTVPVVAVVREELVDRLPDCFGITPSVVVAVQNPADTESALKRCARFVMRRTGGRSNAG